MFDDWKERQLQKSIQKWGEIQKYYDNDPDPLTWDDVKYIAGRAFKTGYSGSKGMAKAAGKCFKMK